jgi:hypothetical protein
MCQAIDVFIDNIPEGIIPFLFQNCKRVAPLDSKYRYFFADDEAVNLISEFLAKNNVHFEVLQINN